VRGALLLPFPRPFVYFELLVLLNEQKEKKRSVLVTDSIFGLQWPIDGQEKHKGHIVLWQVPGAVHKKLVMFHQHGHKGRSWKPVAATIGQADGVRPGPGDPRGSGPWAGAGDETMDSSAATN